MTARGIDSPSVSSQQHVVWVFFFPIILKIKCKQRGAKKTDREGKRKEKENVDVGLHSKQLLPEALCCASLIWEAVRGGKKKKKKKSSSHSQMASQSKANVKRTHMTAGAPVKKSTARRTWWIYRWLYVQGDDEKAITNVSVSFCFHGQNNLCVCVKVAADENAPIWVRMFLFARRIQNRHFCLFFFRWNLKTLNCVRKASQGDE